MNTPPFVGFLAPAVSFGIGHFKAKLIDLTGLVQPPALIKPGNYCLVSSVIFPIEGKKEKKEKRTNNKEEKRKNTACSIMAYRMEILLAGSKCTATCYPVVVSVVLTESKWLLSAGEKRSVTQADCNDVPYLQE